MLRGLDQALGWLVESEVEAGLLLLRAGVEEVQAEQRLAAPREPEQQRGARREQAAAEHRIEVLDAGQDAAVVGRLAELGALREQHLGARPHDQADVADLHVVAAKEVVATAKLEDLDLADRALMRAVERQLDQAVDHRVLGARRVLRAHVREHDRRAARHVRQHLQLGDELLERGLGLAERMRRGQAIEHEQGRLLVGEHAAEQREQAGQPPLAEHEVRADVRDLGADRLGIEERHAGQVAQHARVRLGEQRHVHRLAARRDVREARLVAERRLADARASHDQVHAAGDEPTAEQGVETRNAGRNAIFGAKFGHARQVLRAVRPTRRARRATRSGGSIGLGM